MNKTEGQKRVRLTFNPSGLKRVEDFKQITASAIDYLNDVTATIKKTIKETVKEGEYVDDLGDFMREVATAKTQLQIASMCAVAAITHDTAFKYLPVVRNDIPETGKEEESNLQPHQKRVVDECANRHREMTALISFIETNPIYGTLPKEEQSDLNLQVLAMRSFIDILNRRIKRFTHE